eukprot:CAMPEP_0194029064 /NCGR_PEP_ID=MMETSP0009_2-20130614/2917_1 /TAXON_ID=210454 /ORGANISM="Grammatophora oceanica, Strain CCMP 410" /LENGTH=316 /DNA_ID=CAMNT_0038668651 /DNA_START=55 /DNA_END=1005 /DNA_ORIENTATION=-
MRATASCLALLLAVPFLVLDNAEAYSLPSLFHAVTPEHLHAAHHHAIFLAKNHHVATTAAKSAGNPAFHVLNSYQHLLKEHPLTTKMMTGGSLAMCGDAIAQSATEEPYDKRRGASFGLFDMAYRACQHVSFPLIVEHCKGQFAMATLGALPGMTAVLADKTDYLAAMEQTLASQLGIVPFLYYPVFFTLTGFLQGLTQEQAIQRAQENFVPLMQRNLLFWIPVQFVQFEFIPTDLQIPFLSVCGLCWTFILSVMAGSAKGYSEEDAEGEIAVVMAEEQELADVAAALVLEADASGAEQREIEGVPVHDKAFAGSR